VTSPDLSGFGPIASAVRATGGSYHDQHTTGGFGRTSAALRAVPVPQL